MIALSKQAILRGGAIGLVLMAAVFLYFKYQTLHPCGILRQDILHEAAAAGESRRITEVAWKRAEPQLHALRCIRAYAAPSRRAYVQNLARSPES